MALTTTGSPFSLNIPSASSDLADLFGSYLVPNMTAINTYAAHKATAQTFSALQTFSAGLNVTAGNVGIGTAIPSQLLTVAGQVRIAYSSSYTGMNISNKSASASVSGVSFLDFGNENEYAVTSLWGEIRTDGGSSLGIHTTPAGARTSDRKVERMRVDHNGNVGIGTTSPGYLLTLASDSAAKPTSNTWTISSDARVKEVIGSYTRGVADIMALEPKRYRLNGAFGSVDDGRVHVSVVAQEAQATWPEMIGTYEHTNEDDVETVTELLNLNTNELQWALVNAIKELAQRVEALEA